MYYVYILTNKSNNVLYTGVTNDIERRLNEHEAKAVGGFTARYNVDKCVYLEECSCVTDAIAREKQIKGWSRKKKFDLISSVNPEFRDLRE